MVESQTLKLVQASAELERVIGDYLTQALKDKGYESITPSLLSFLSVLECGVNYGSEIARTLGVSRQMVAKTVKELCRLGYLEQADDIGKQKKILFTNSGEQLIADARHLLADIDSVITKNINKKEVSSAIEHLQTIHQSIFEQKKSEQTNA